MFYTDIPVEIQETRLQEIRQWPEAIHVDRLFGHDDDPELTAACYAEISADADVGAAMIKLSTIPEIELVEPPAQRYAL